MGFYENWIRPALFSFDPEWIHDRVMQGLVLTSRVSLLNNLVSKAVRYSHPSLETDLFGLNFANPVGLSAGFDKALNAPLAYGALGFGFAELGSITYKPQPGNPKPRLWRLPQDKSLVVNYGLNSQGAVNAKGKMVKIKGARYKRALLGVSIARTTDIAEKDTVNDYLKSFKLLAPLADYVTLNVSCPNVVGYTGLQNKKFLNSLLKEIQSYNREYVHKPVFIKAGSDDLVKLMESVEVMAKYKVDAVIISNLLKGKRPKLQSANRDKTGGISGKPLEKQANEAIRAVYREYGQSIRIVGVGGIFTAEDAYRKIRLGASLLQLFTGFIYGGPLTVKNINRGLTKLLARDGFGKIQEAVGTI